MYTKSISLLLLIMALILAACGGPEEGGAVLTVATETPAPTDAPTTGITATADTATATPAATVTAPAPTGYSLQLAITPLPATGSIRGLVFQDTNRDNRPDDDEPVEGALVRLSGGVECQTRLAETTTAVGGAYAFYDLPAGAYCVEVVTDAVTVSSLVELGAGEDAVDVNLSWPGLPPTSSIGGLVYEDSNGNGSYDGGEPTVANVGVYLIPHNCNGTGLLDNTVSAADGRYHFTGLQAGTYCAATVGANGHADKQPFTLGTGQSRTDLHLRTD